ncbi:MAG TPA: FliM/FliN family flagellar motor switch protein [Rhodanobacter sp.]
MAEGNRDAGMLPRDMGLIGHVEVALVAEIGHAEMTVDELFKLRKDDVVRLKQCVDEPVTLLLDGKAVAKGALVAIEDHLGIKITEIL